MTAAEAIDGRIQPKRMWYKEKNLPWNLYHGSGVERIREVKTYVSDIFCLIAVSSFQYLFGIFFL